MIHLKIQEFIVFSFICFECKSYFEYFSDFNHNFLQQLILYLELFLQKDHQYHHRKFIKDSFSKIIFLVKINFDCLIKVFLKIF
jgi:hypothetical protein